MFQKYRQTHLRNKDYYNNQKKKKKGINILPIKKFFGGGGVEVFPYMGYIVICGPKGYGFLAVLV